jgi:hypothetical protein
VDSTPLLDYASPRPRTKVRLPSRSILVCHTDRDSCDVIETLSGKAGALAALIFAAFVMTVMPMLLFANPGLNTRGDVAALLILETPLILVGGLVVRNTWRRTRLRANADGLVVTFSAPFLPEQFYRFAPRELASLQLATVDPVNALAELRIIPINARPIYLFTDHPQRELANITSALAATLGVMVTE